MIRKKFLLAILVILIVTLPISIKSFQSMGKVSNPDDTVKHFLELVDKGEYSKVIDEGMILWVPFDPLNREGNSGMDLSKAEGIGLDKASSTPEEIRDSQSQLLKDETEIIRHTFGEDAFKNITFTKERNDGVLDTVWVDTRTGKQITPQEAEKASIAFYDRLFRDSGFTEDEINEVTNAAKSQTLTKDLEERMLKLDQIVSANANNCPAQLKPITIEGYIYHLSFGLPESNKDYHNFFIRIEYRNGKWVTLCGIEMDLPEGEPGDV
jgi:phage pi2 protein 07